MTKILIMLNNVSAFESLFNYSDITNFIDVLNRLKFCPGQNINDIKGYWFVSFCTFYHTFTVSCKIIIFKGIYDELRSSIRRDSFNDNFLRALVHWVKGGVCNSICIQIRLDFSYIGVNSMAFQ